jgi:hypothetical protein
MTLIVSSIPGRLRLRARNLDAALPEAIATMTAWPGVGEVVHNPRAASLLIRYDPRILSQASMEAAALGALGAADEAAPAALTDIPEADAEPTNTGVQRRQWRSDINRNAKYGAMAAMTVSLLALPARRRRLHVEAGVLALVFTGVHMYI